MVKQLYTDLTDVVLSLDADVAKIYNNRNKAAGTRVRKQCQKIKDLAQQLRCEILNSVKAEKEE